MKGSLYSGSRPSTPSHSSHQNSVSPPQEMVMEDVVDQAESVIKRWDVDHHEFSPVFSGNRKEAALLLEAVAGLQSAMHYYVNLTPNSHKLITAQKLMRIAIKRLEKEFYVILSSNRKNLDSESVSTHSSTSTLSDLFEDDISNSVEQTSDMAMADLKSIANCMIGSGYGKECVRIYTLIRRSIVDETLYYLGVDKLSHSKIQKMDWDLLETKIKSWLHALRVAVKTLFHGERILCDVVFSCSERISESTFAAISTDAAVTLFGFATNL
ncbi:exocyst subunit exo70 family protein H4 [Striga hermonthica]|uniref:Exocyst subunit Exo70 family protein n=1 Tax=Striga hermonthica TaxID=68872 RepID=A0A9N7RLY7_STRHE|nr:exocyst subunit exo70 family protein H4 [Striga hermonthica]